MKASVVLLFVAVGVCSAAFTGSLVQQTRPALNRASLQASIATSALAKGDKDLGDFLQGIVDSAIATANGLVAQLQAAAEAAAGHVVNLSISLKIKIRAAIAALQSVANAVSGSIQSQIQSLISTLQGFLSGGDSADNARNLLAQLDVHAILSNAIQHVLGHLQNNQFIANLIAQVTPFLDQAGNIIQQVTDLLLGNSKLSAAAPRGLFDQLQNIIATIQSVIGSAVESAQAAAQQLVQQAIAHGQATVQAAAAQVLQTVQSLAAFLPSSIVQPLIEALENLAN
jgi:predicted PurR-regulated permease PerM